MGHRDEGERIMNDDPAALAFIGFPFRLRPVRWLVGRLARMLTRYGRGGDRETLTLSDRDERLIAAVATANPRTVVVLVGGSAIRTGRWRDRVPAVLLAWYPGMEGGRAVADVLTGAEEPGGRLPFAIPADPAHLPFFDAEATEISYDAWWGQRKLDRDCTPAEYPFGFGLGYTTFEIKLVEQHQTTATVRVVNSGARAGATVVQLYATDRDAPRPVHHLVGFRRVELAAGAEATVEVDLDLTPTRQRDPATRIWSPRPGRWDVVAAPHSPGSLA
jgi:beta-glucosidase